MADDKSLITLLQQREDEIKAVIPSWLDKDRFMQSAYELRYQWLKDPNLRKCSNESLVNCVYESARTGLEFSAKHAYVVAYGDEATFMPGWRGKVFLKIRSAAVKTIVPDIVYEHDEFFIERDSTNPELARLVHRYAKGDRGKPIAAYAMAKLISGEVDFEVCSKDRIDRSKRQSKQPNGLMWGTFWEEGWKKTPIHVLDKRLPEGLNTEAIKAYRLALALEVQHEPVEDAELTDDERPRAKGSAQPQPVTTAGVDAASAEAQVTVAANPPAQQQHTGGEEGGGGRLATVMEAVEDVEAMEETPPAGGPDRFLDSKEEADVAHEIEDVPPLIKVQLFKRFGLKKSLRELKLSQIPEFLSAAAGVK